MTNAIKDSNIVVLIFSKYSINSNFVNTEIDKAFGSGKPIIVFKVDNSKLEGGLKFFLNGKHWIDATSNYKDYLYTLVYDTYQLVNDYQPINDDLLSQIIKPLKKAVLNL